MPAKQESDRKRSVRGILRPEVNLNGAGRLLAVDRVVDWGDLGEALKQWSRWFVLVGKVERVETTVVGPDRYRRVGWRDARLVDLGAGIQMAMDERVFADEARVEEGDVVVVQAVLSPSLNGRAVNLEPFEVFQFLGLEMKGEERIEGEKREVDWISVGLYVGERIWRDVATQQLGVPENRFGVSLLVLPSAGRIEESCLQ